MLSLMAAMCDPLATTSVHDRLDTSEDMSIAFAAEILGVF